MLQRPQAVSAIITQNGNAYVEGLGQGFWGDVENVWANPTPENKQTLKEQITSFDTTKWQVSPLGRRLDPYAVLTMLLFNVTVHHRRT